MCVRGLLIRHSSLLLYPPPSSKVQEVRLKNGEARGRARSSAELVQRLRDALIEGSAGGAGVRPEDIDAAKNELRAAIVDLQGQREVLKTNEDEEARLTIALATAIELARSIAGGGGS